MLRRFHPVTIASLLAALCLAAAVPAAAQTKLLRFPDIHGDTIAFVYAGDLWTVPVTGGDARRITAHPGLELFPRFSPDGRWIAFTGQYDGDEQVYVVPATGGEPKRLTWYPAAGPLPPRWGYDNQVYGWTPDGEKVLFRSMRQGWDLTDTRLYTVGLDGGLPEPLPMPVSGAGDLSPDGTRAVYTPLTRDFRTWKRYQGGWAQDLWIYDLASHDVRQLTDDPRTDRDPMWIGDTIVFASDRGGTLNLYAADAGTGETRQLTHSTLWDVRWPAADADGRIVYESNGELVVYDLRDGSEGPVRVRVPTDALASRPSRIPVGDAVSDVGLSPRGERALFVARGDLFTVPIENGPVRNLTRSSGAHDKHARWSPDGRWIAYVSDATGEEELYRIAQDGSGAPEQLTSGGSAMRFAPAWSPDSSRIAISDKDGKLYVLTVANRSIREIADATGGFITDFTWAPDGRHLAFSMADATGFSALYVWSDGGGPAEDQLRRVTDPLFNSFSPAWDRAGNYLYYLSDRGFAPQIGSFEWNYVVDRETGIYALALRRDVPHPLPPESDEVEIAEEAAADEKAEKAEKKADKKADKKTGKPEKEAADGDEGEWTGQRVLRIDFDGLGDRITRLPVPFDNYQSLLALADGKLLYFAGTAFYYGRPPVEQSVLSIFSFEDRESHVIAKDIQDGGVSADGKKLILGDRGGYKLYDAKPGAADGAKAVSTDGLYVDRVPREEWAQIFDEVWRRYRDFFYVPNMHGYDWQALRDQYRPLLEHLGHRSDLNYLIGEMIGELNVGHAYIAGGDWLTPDRPEVALPGAWFELDRTAGRYRLGKIFHGDNGEPKYRAPLTEVGVDIATGDYVLAIDGEELTGDDNPYRLLLYKADRPVELTVNSRPSFDGSRKVSFRPIDNEDDLIYLDWVTDNRRRVEELSDGRLGYIHLPDMGPSGIYEFIKHYYGQLRKEGLVIDVRNNGGGNVSAMVIERLSRELLSVGSARNSEFLDPYPTATFHGHLVCLLNENSASDGDIFPAMFRAAGLGPLIGKRSWGGVVGITNRGNLIDGGSVSVPEFGTLSADGQWIIEGHGVDPDIEVDNTPADVAAGRDPQLETGVRVLLDKIEAEPRRYPTLPAPPVKTERGLEGSGG